MSASHAGVRRTPLILSAELGVELKLENLQRTGSFKIRGAIEACRRLSAADRSAGVVVASAGNHGAGMAWACQQAGMALRVVVPTGTPDAKTRRIREAGAEVIVFADNYDDAEAHAVALAGRDGATFISAFDDEAVIAGNGGTLALEILDQRPEVETVIVPVGGGGMIAGLARELAPRGIAVIGAQPRNNCAMHESLALGRALTDYVGKRTVAKGCEGAVGALAFRIAQPHIARTVLVSERAIASAVAHAYHHLGLVLECSGAVALAAVREGCVEPGRVVCVLSGGNIDDAELDAVLANAVSEPTAMDR